MKEINHNELKREIKQSYLVKKTICVYGGIGIGKSESVRQVAEEIAKEKNKDFVEWNNTTHEEKRELLKNCKNKFIFADLRASLLDPTDLRGLPNYFDGVVEWKPQILFKVMENKDCDGILFFDELFNAPPSVMVALYQLILDRAIGEISLNNQIGIVCAGNKAEEVGSIFDIPEPLRNRMQHYELRLEHKLWEEWAFKKNIHPDIISYLHWKPNRLYTFNRKDKDPCFATPRMWFFLSELIENATPKEKEIRASGTIGEGVAIEFIAFLELQDKLNVDDLLEFPEKIKEINKIDQKYALLGAIVERYKRDKTILKNIFEICRNLEPEYSILLLRYIIRIYKLNGSHIDLAKEVKKIGGWDLLERYRKYFD